MSRAIELLTRCFAIAVAATVSTACGDDVRPPPSPPLEAGVDGMLPCAFGCPQPMDGGPPDAAAPEDGATIDGDMAEPSGLCADFPRAGSSVTRPVGFTPTDIVARWNRESCAVPELIVALTEGDCGLTRGERIELRFSESNFTDGRIVIGANSIFSDGTHPLRMTYVSTTVPSTRVGTCGAGLIEIDMLALNRGGRLIARFDVTLDNCEVFGDPGVSLIGSFDVPILESSRDACP